MLLFPLFRLFLFPLIYFVFYLFFVFSMTSLNISFRLLFILFYSVFLSGCSYICPAAILTVLCSLVSITYFPFFRFLFFCFEIRKPKLCFIMLLSMAVFILCDIPNDECPHPCPSSCELMMLTGFRLFIHISRSPHIQ